MKHNREYEIAWQGLKPGPHHSIYNIDSRFMEEREVPADLSNWDVRVSFTFDKHENFFMLKFDIDGKVTVPCDRCGDDFELRLWDEFDLLVKLTGGEDEDIPEEEDDVVFIPRSETVLDVRDWLYEFVMLSVPLQRIHPDHEDGTPGCNEHALSLLDKLSEPEVAPNETDEGELPMWKALEALKNLETKNKKK